MELAKLCVSENVPVVPIPGHCALGSSIFGDTRKCVIAREMAKFHEEFWRGSLGEANHVFSTRLPKGELTILIEGQANSKAEPPSTSAAASPSSPSSASQYGFSSFAPHLTSCWF
ncbi:hypothetical protein KIW84_070907 [Lathyrus oleraceus]|uniref:Uncharacterized protein n=1 Tax=Pisum sativum TaxID=3888 RepID=A0A9D4ZU74_PEA|nr:hypothetical protein KIW84_070907 [Pisum sativum]